MIVGVKKMRLVSGVAVVVLAAVSCSGASNPLDQPDRDGFGQGMASGASPGSVAEQGKPDRNQRRVQAATCPKDRRGAQFDRPHFIGLGAAPPRYATGVGTTFRVNGNTYSFRSSACGCPVILG